MAKKHKKSKKRKSVTAVMMRHNPGAIEIAKKVAPGVGSFIVTALASAQLPKFIPGVNATDKRQKIAGLLISLGAGAGVVALSRRSAFVERNKVSLLAGIGVSVILQLVRLFVSPKNALLQQMKLSMPAQQRATGDIYDDQATSWVDQQNNVTSRAATIHALEDEVADEMAGDENWSF